MFIIIAVVLVILFIKLRPYFYRYDTVIGFTGGLGSGKTFESVNVAIRQLKKNRIRTSIYNFIATIFKRPRLDKPLLYSSIPIRISKREYSQKLTKEQLLLQEKFVKGSIVFIDEVDVWANQFAHANPNIIETLSKRDIEKGVADEQGIFDEHMRLFRHYHASPCCEPKLIVNTQATSNIITVIRRRINSVYVLSKFRIIKIPFLCHIPIIRIITQFYVYRVREITISDDIVNYNAEDANEHTRLFIGFVPSLRHYDTHCYSERVEAMPYTESRTWNSLKTKRLLKCPYEKYESKCIDDSSEIS